MIPSNQTGVIRGGGVVDLKSLDEKGGLEEKRAVGKRGSLEEERS